uniref:hypothetical protein n=1 Tax=uncultured Dubosiella sp. TaxID=1937011 RepID=UPI00272E4301
MKVKSNNTLKELCERQKVYTIGGHGVIAAVWRWNDGDDHDAGHNLLASGCICVGSRWRKYTVVGATNWASQRQTQNHTTRVISKSTPNNDTVEFVTPYIAVYFWRR